MVLHAGDMEHVMSELIWHLEDLRVGQCYPNYYIARLAGKFVKVVLSGTGGDELFAGYPWRYYRGAAPAGFDEYVEQYYRFWHRLIPNRYFPRLFRADVWKDARDVRTIDIFREALGGEARAPRTVEEHVNRALTF